MSDRTPEQQALDAMCRAFGCSRWWIEAGRLLCFEKQDEHTTMRFDLSLAVLRYGPPPTS